MENEKSTFDTVIDDAQEYFNSRQELATLKIAEKSSKAISAAMAGILLSALFLLVILFASIALGFALTVWFGSSTFGFLGVAVLYLLMFLILFANKQKWLMTPMENTVIKNFLKINTMARIENAQQLRTEIERMEMVCKQHEVKLKEDLQELKKDFTPLNIILNTISSLTGVKLNQKEFLNDGIGFGISTFFQRLILKTEKIVENKVYDFVDTGVEKLIKFMSKAVDPSEKRKARRDEREEDE